MGLHVERIVTLHAFEALAPEWSHLEAGLFPRMPFTSPCWSLLWWKHFRRGHLSSRDRLNVYAVRGEAGTLIAVAPMMISHRPSIGPLRTRELQFMGADSNVTELRGIVCRPDDALRVTIALRAAILGHKADWDWVQWRGLPSEPDSPDWQRQLRGFKAQWTIADHYLELPDSWDAFRSGLPRNVKEALRKCYNSLTRDGHAFIFRAVSAPADMQEAIEIFLELHGQRAKVTGSVDHLNIFAEADARAFLHEYAAVMAERDRIRVFELVIGGVVVASRIAFLLEDEMYLYFSGYDPDWGKYSVMTTVVAEALQWAIANGFRIANLSTGTDLSKTRWRPESVSYVEGFEVAPTRRGALAFGVMHRLRRITQRLGT